MTDFDDPSEPPLARYRTQLVLLGALALAVGLWFAVDLWRPLPERSFVMATGAPGGAYAGFGEQYRTILARNDVELRLQPTAGSTANLALLRDPGSGVAAAFVQGGAVPQEAFEELVSLGTVFYEPIWFFCRCEPGPDLAKVLQGMRISIGPVGSGGHDVALKLLELNGIARDQVRLLELSSAETADGLESGELDAALLTAAWEAPILRRLLLAPGVRLVSFPRAEAYVALYPYLTRLRLPMGVADLAANRPPEDVTLVAGKAMLLVRRDLHPALQYLLMQAAVETHGRPGIFQAARQFPAPEEIDVPLSPQARNFYLNGPSFLQRHLPFWFAEIVQRLLLVLAPLLGILYPLLSGLPSLYRWRIEHRVYRLYGELKWIEVQLHDTPAGPERQRLLDRLAALEERVAMTKLPKAYSAMGFTLRMHIRMLRETGLGEARTPAAGKAAG